MIHAPPHDAPVMPRKQAGAISHDSPKRGVQRGYSPLAGGYGGGPPDFQFLL